MKCSKCGIEFTSDKRPGPILCDKHWMEWSHVEMKRLDKIQDNLFKIQFILLAIILLSLLAEMIFER